MIHIYNHKNIDKRNYSNCLHNSLNYRVYAELWYLDIVSPDGYDILVLNNFEAVMPIAYHKKLGMKFVIQPTFCQQLGIFYKENISAENFSLFLSFLNRYRVRSYCFNEENTSYFPTDCIKRDNQILNLESNYLTISNNYNKNKKRVLKNDFSPSIEIEEGYIDSVIKGTLFTHLHNFLSESQIDILNSLLLELNHRNLLKQYTVYREQHIPTVYLWLIFSKGRIINLLSVRNKEIEIKNSYAYLIDLIIQKYSNQKLIFDFEGSMIQGIANFNKSLGAKTKHYIPYKNFKWFDALKKR